jgi:hypothetical protein
VRNLVRDHPRLARPRPGQHQAGPAGETDGLELGEVETGRHGVAQGAKRWIIPGASCQGCGRRFVQNVSLLVSPDCQPQYMCDSGKR